MSPIDNTVTSREVSRLYGIRDLLATSPSLQELSEATEAELLELIAVGPVNEPLDSDEWSRSELANQFFLCHVASADEAGYSVVHPNTSMECAPMGGNITIYLRRHVREIEHNMDTHQLYMWFLDRCSAAIDYLMEVSLTSNQVRMIDIEREFGPFFADVASEVGQGKYIWCTWTGSWGLLDLEN